MEVGSGGVVSSCTKLRGMQNRAYGVGLVGLLGLVVRVLTLSSYDVLLEIKSRCSCFYSLNFNLQAQLFILLRFPSFFSPPSFILFPHSLYNDNDNHESHP